MTPIFADLITPSPFGGGVGAGFPIALGITVSIEFLVVYFLARKVFHISATFARIAAAGTIPSIVTLSVVIGLGLAGLGASMPEYLILEVLVVLAEAFMIQKILEIAFKPALWISLAANIASVVIGFIILGAF